MCGSGGVEIRVTLGRIRLEGVGASIVKGCRSGRRLGCRPAMRRSRDSARRRRASSAESRVDSGNTPPMVGCGVCFSRELGAPRSKSVFFSLVPFPVSGGDSRLLRFEAQIRPALKRNHINEPPIVRMKIAVATKTPVTSASITCKIYIRRGYEV